MILRVVSSYTFSRGRKNRKIEAITGSFRLVPSRPRRFFRPRKYLRYPLQRQRSSGGSLDRNLRTSRRFSAIGRVLWPILPYVPHYTVRRMRTVRPQQAGDRLHTACPQTPDRFC